MWYGLLKGYIDGKRSSDWYSELFAISTSGGENNIGTPKLRNSCVNFFLHDNINLDVLPVAPYQVIILIFLN